MGRSESARNQNGSLAMRDYLMIGASETKPLSFGSCETRRHGMLRKLWYVTSTPCMVGWFIRPLHARSGYIVEVVVHRVHSIYGWFFGKACATPAHDHREQGLNTLFSG